MLEFIGNGKKLVRGRIADQPTNEDLAFALADAILPLYSPSSFVFQ